MTLADVVQELVQRLGSGTDTVLTWEQARHWPRGAIDAFHKAGWIAPIAEASMVECPGCAENCFMPVQVLPARNGRPPRAYVSCDRPADMGRVNIPLSRMRQWQITDAQVARWISRSLGLKGKVEQDLADGMFRLGSLQGNSRLGSLRFDTGAPASLKVFGHSLPLAEVIDFEQGRPSIDRAAILHMVDLPPATDREGRYQPSTARREARKLDTQAMHERWRKAYRALKRRHRNKSDVWCSLQIAKSDNPDGRSAETIRKHMTK